MRLIILLVVWTFCFVGIGDAQSKFGLRAGANYSNIIGDSQSNDPKIGITGGFYWNKKLLKNVDLEFDLLYSQLGAKSGDSLNFNYNYLVFPMLLKLRLTQEWNLQAGFQASALVSAKVKEDSSPSEDVKTLVQPFDFPVVIGLGFNLNENMNLTGRYHYGLINVPNNTNANDIRNSFFSVTLGYFFDKKKADEAEE